MATRAAPAKNKKTRKKAQYQPFEWRSLNGPVIGVDEVGRGCLAGRVYAAAVILKSEIDIDQYTDSKLLSEDRREILFTSIQTHHHVGLGYATPEEIDRFNILQASFLAMRRAIAELGLTTGYVLVDGHMKIPGLLGYQQIPLVKGDLRAAPISAASIAAKVTRDRVMKELASLYPKYGFEKHKGYGTEEHRKALEVYGPCGEHRRSFCGIGMFEESLTLFEV